MYNKSHALREMYEFYHDREKALAESSDAKLRERDTEVQEFIAQMDKYRKQRELKDSELGKFTEAVYDNHMQTVLEAIYITALQKVAPLTEEAEEIAKSLVENYIKESGGAREIIRTKSGKTFLLDTIFEAVDDAAQKDINLFFEAKDDDEKEEKEEKEKKEESDGSDDVDKEDIKLGDADGDGVDDSQDSDFGTGSDNDKNEEASDSKEKSDEKKDKEDEEAKEEKEDDKKEDSKESEDNEKEDESDDDDEEPTDVEDLDKEEVEDDEEEVEEPAEDPDLDKPDTAETVAASQEEPPMGTEPEEEPEIEDLPTSKEELFDKLEDSQDVNDAVDIIAKRISDAETKFIEKNSEDKKKIENIVNKMQDRIDAVTQDEDSDSEEIETENQEAQIEATRRISEIRNDRFHTLYEMMVRDNMDYIYKNQTLNESYKVDGKIDMTRVMDNSRTMYGWLETVNTIQLEKVNERYIQKLVENMY